MNPHQDTNEDFKYRNQTGELLQGFKHENNFIFFLFIIDINSVWEFELTSGTKGGINTGMHHLLFQLQLLKVLQHVHPTF